jgi:hypothetical protein
LGVVLEKNGEIVATPTAAAVLGNPLAAVAMMANHLTARGQLIPAGTPRHSKQPVAPSPPPPRSRSGHIG